MPFMAGQKLRAADLNPSFARYYKTASQTAIANGIGTGVRFDTAGSTSSDVTANTNKDQFTLNRTGIWQIETSPRVTGNTSASTNWECFAIIGPTAGSTAVRYGGADVYVPTTTGTGSLSLACVRPFTSGDTVGVTAYGLGTAGSTFDFTFVSEQVHISFVYIGPT